MKKIILFQLCIGFAAMTFGQAGKLKGIIYDSLTRSPLELATVSIFNQDSSLVSYQISDKNGMVSFEKLPVKKRLFINVSFVGYNSYQSLLQLNGSDTLLVFLSLNTKDTSSVVVKTTVPVRMNGDTLEINPSAFKMKEYQVAEELLNQVPGIMIWADGSITVGGRKVQNLFVDGKPFLGSTDPRIATQNLPKSAIDKIQLYQEYNRANIGNQEKPQPTDSVLTMNIKLKEAAKKGYFGKGGAGYGTGNTTESDLVLQTYGPKNSWALGGGYNNINKDIGSVNQMLQNNTFRTANPDLYRVGRFGGSGINNSYSIGGVLNQNFGEITPNSRQNNRLTVNYNLSGTDALVISQRDQDRIALGQEQHSKDESRQNSRSNRHSVDVSYSKTNSYNDNLNMSGSASVQKRDGVYNQYTEITNPGGLLQSTNTVTSRQTDNSGNESFNLSFAKNDYDRPLTNLNVSGNIQRNHGSSEREVVSVFKSMTVNNKDTSYNRRYTNSNESINARANLNYGGFKRLVLGRYNLGGINLNFTQDINYSRSTNYSVVTDFDSSSKNYLANKNLTNNNSRQTASYNPALSITKSTSRSRPFAYSGFNFQAKLIGDFRNEKNVSTIAQRNLDRSFKFLRYDAGLSFILYNQKKYNFNSSLNYSKGFEYPSIDALYTIVDDINVYSITIGNPNLKNRTTHNLNLYTNFNTQNAQSPYTFTFSINAGYNLAENPVTDSVINTADGKRISYYINADQSRNLNLGYTFNIAKKMQKNNLQLIYQGNYNTGKQPNYIDGAYNLSRNARLSNQLSLRFMLASLLVAGVTERLEQNWVDQTASAFNYFKNSSSTTNFNLNLNYPENFSFGSTVDYVNTSTLSKPIVLWNVFATHRFMKQQAELKVTATDILKQYVNISTSANAYGTSTYVTNGLQQYFMVTFSYYPRKFGKKTGVNERIGLRSED
jgi:hypothetical protein